MQKDKTAVRAGCLWIIKGLHWKLLTIRRNLKLPIKPTQPRWKFLCGNAICLYSVNDLDLSQVCVLHFHDPLTTFSHKNHTFFHQPILSPSLMTALRRHFCRRQTHCCKHNALPVWSAYLAKRCWCAECWGTLGWKALDKYKAWIYINSNTRHGISNKINCHLTQGWETERSAKAQVCNTSP